MDKYRKIKVVGKGIFIYEWFLLNIGSFGYALLV